MEKPGAENYEDDELREPAELTATQLGTENLYSSLEGEGIITDPVQRSDILQRLFRYVDENEKNFVDNLREAIAIQSVSELLEGRSECLRMIEYTGLKLRELGFEIQCRKIGTEEIKGERMPMPPILLASKSDDPKKNTVLIYGHLDVKPAMASDGWCCEPFYLTEEGDQLYGRGTTDNKGPVFAWIHAIESFVNLNIKLPVNVKFVLESMEESESERLRDLLMSLKDNFLKDVDLVIMSDNQWLTKFKPCVTYGVRGLAYFFLEVECGSKDLHSGVFGGIVHEAMADLIWLLNQLTDSSGKIQIPEVIEEVFPVTVEEEALYKNIEFDVEEFRKDCGVNQLSFPGNKIATLMHRWRYPVLSIHGIQGAFGGPGARTVIPRKVIGKFSIRLVPNMTPTKVDSAVKSFLKTKWIERNSPNKMRIYMADDGIVPYCANPYHPAFKAARQAIAWAYEDVPNMTREGGSIEALMHLQEATQKNVVLLPMGCSDDGAHQVNEKINKMNYFNGTKSFAAYLVEVGKLNKSVF